jgi:APA family basic amino acid/polyamine antiporter
VRVRGYDLPLFAVFGALGTSIAFVVTVVLHPVVAATGSAWLILGVLVYVVYRRRQGLDLGATHTVAITQPVVDHEAEYDSVLVPVLDGHYDAQVMATAAKLAARKRRGIHVLALVTVPNALTIDASLREAERGADSAIEQAKIQIGRRVTGHTEKIRAGQAGRRIIEEAGDMRAAAIVMPLPRRVDGASLFGKTLETVLAERPCRVIIESSPADGRLRRVVPEKASVAP